MKRSMPATPLFSSSGVPTKAFRGLLSLTGIEEADPRAIRDLTQRAWYKEGKTSAQIVEEDAHLRERAVPFFRDLKLIGIPRIDPGQFQWMVGLGATYVAMHKRYASAVRAWKEAGLRFSNVAYLVSNRPRYAEMPLGTQEKDDVILQPVVGGLAFHPGWQRPAKLPDTEAEIMQMILAQVGHHRPWNSSPQHEHMVIAPNQPDGKAAGTIGTLQAFVDQCNPRGSALLVVSSQPHMLRQLLDATNVLGDRFERYEVTGYDIAPEDVNVTKTLHELSNLIHQLVVPA